MIGIYIYKNIIAILSKYYDMDICVILNKKENIYLIILLMKNFKRLNDDNVKKELGISNRMLTYRLKKAEEKILINKDFREDYFLLEEKIKENLRNA